MRRFPIFFVLCLALLANPVMAAACSDLLENQHKIEVKSLIPDLAQLPPGILNALKQGEEHPGIHRRGFVVQEYLPVTAKNIARIFSTLKHAGITFGAPEALDDFLFPGHAREIRLMRKCILEHGVIKEIYQITIQGSGTVSVDKIETPEALTADQLQRLKTIFSELGSEVYSIVRKAYFEIPATNRMGEPLKAGDGTDRAVKVDISISNVDGRHVPGLITGEIEFREASQQNAIEQIAAFRSHPELRPAYFGTDLTDQLRIKARNIALMGVPASAQAALEAAKTSNEFNLNKIIKQFRRWASPEITTLALTPPAAPMGTFIEKKILLNAEPFGFGPSAAIAELFPYLRQRVETLGYIGIGHTLDLQHRLPYDEVHDYAAATLEERRVKFLSAARHYDVFITASDFEAADWAKSIGLKVVIYDPLTWYWAEIPAAVARSDFYVAQNFFGVTERLQREPEKFPAEHTIVPAIVSGLDNLERGEDKKALLVNMGGLSNPFLNNDDLATFARVVFGSVQDTLASAFQQTTLATSRSIADRLAPDFPVKTYQPQQIQKILAESELAIMTSGLGNIYEASAMGKKVLWLPPANDSQGQQVKLLQRHGMVDWAIDWHDFLDGEEAINYSASQQDVLQRIAHCMKRLAAEPQAQAKFRRILSQTMLEARLRQTQPPALAELVRTFEANGSRLAADSIVQFLQ